MFTRKVSKGGYESQTRGSGWNRYRNTQKTHLATKGEFNVLEVSFSVLK